MSEKITNDYHTWPFRAQEWLNRFYSNARRFYSSKGDPLGVKGSIVWLALWLGKINQNCDWSPDQPRKCHLFCPGSSTTNISHKKVVSFFPYDKFFIGQDCVQLRWLDIGLILFFTCSWTLILSQSINTQKKNLGNIQPCTEYNTNFIVHSLWGLFRDNDEVLKILQVKIYIKDETT